MKVNTATINDEQQQAIDYIDGPLLIIAGAGTGKTTVITQKIVHLISSGLAKPEEILALTFTDKAAEEMQTRVDSLLERGYLDVSISTFHAFCQRLLEETGLDIGIPHRFKLLTETDAWILLKDHIYDLNLNYYRPLGNPTRHIQELLNHFSKCKDELISPADYLKYAEEVMLNADAVPEEGRSDDPKRLKEVAEAYHAYNKLLLDNTALDFGDLIFYAVTLLRERPHICARLRQRYKYILVDEFQDVNYAQYELVKELAESSQLTVVGDDDQSIYAFRGASVSNILRFKEDFPNLKEIVLKKNYRSRQEILDLAYTSIQHNNPDRLEARLGVDKHLVAATEKEEPGIIEHLHSSTVEEEVQAVVRKIKTLRAQNISWDHIAILVRANNHAEPFIQGLEAAGIPYEFLAASGLYRQEIILDCFNFFKVIVQYHDSAALYRLLRLPCLKMSESDIQKLTAFAKKKSISYYEALKRPMEWGVSSEGQKVCDTIIHFLHEGMKRSRQEKPTTVLYQFLEDSNYLRYLAHEEETGNASVIRQIFYLKQFFDFISRYEATIPGVHVAGFVEHYSAILEAGDDGKFFQPVDTPDSVNILTIHSAKGLEFDYVFLVNMVEDRFPTRRRSSPIEIPLNLVKEQLPQGDFHIQEERRLLYVGMTRAKKGLFFTSASSYGGVQKKKLSRFLVEVGYAESEQTKSRATIPTYTGSAPKAEGHVVYDLPKAFSFSQIKMYETCPYQYKLAHVLKIPVKGNASFSFGQSMHTTLQKFYEKIQELNSLKQESLFGAPTPSASPGVIRVPSFEELLHLYDESWIADWYKSKKQREEYYKKGKNILKLFYSSHENNWTIPLSLESWFKIKVGDYTIHGRIDRIDVLPDKTLEIIDYKTGKSKEKVIGEDKEQLLIYQIAVASLPEYKHIGTPSKLTFYYINDNIQTSFIGKDKELEKVKEKLIGTLQSITHGEFTATPNPFICQTCEYRDICEFRAI